MSESDTEIKDETPETEDNPDATDDGNGLADAQSGVSGSPDPAVATKNLRFLQNIEVKLSVEVGGTYITIKDLLNLNEGSIVELDKQASELLDVFINGTLLAKGEVVMIGEKFGIRVTEIVSAEERVQNI